MQIVWRADDYCVKLIEREDLAVIFCSEWNAELLLDFCEQVATETAHAGYFDRPEVLQDRDVVFCRPPAGADDADSCFARHRLLRSSTRCACRSMHSDSRANIQCGSGHPS